MNLLDLAIKIGVDDQASSKVSVIADKIGNGIKTAAKVGIAAVTAAGTAITALAKQSIDAYAEYEQLVGGVDTLFKTSSQKVQGYAANAYKTAGMSANQYMSTVTSFSASLLQSLKGDTEAAAEYADMAITDMADNANKMGTSMEMIQNAYQGFAKQNYTMLDNLKLGYGGTKTEMQRLIEDANRVKAANGEMANLSIERFGDVVEAIHVMQTQMGITGTTAKEASETISGSTASMKAAWENLKTGIADENADMELLIGNFVDSAYTAADNLLDRVFFTVDGIKNIFSDPEQRSKFIQLGKDLLGQISDGMKETLGFESDENPITWAGKTARNLVVKFTDLLSEYSDDVIIAGQKLLGALWDGLTANDDTTGRSYEFVAGKIVGNVIKGIYDAIYTLGTGARKVFNNIGDLLIAAITGDQETIGNFMNEFNAAEKEFWAGVGYGIDPNAGYVSSGYNYDVDTSYDDITPELTKQYSDTFIPSPTSSPAVKDMRTSIVNNFNVIGTDEESARRMANIVEEELEFAEAANG